LGRKRPERTARRQSERAARQLVRDRERLATLVPGGAADRPIEVTSSSVIESRARSLKCPQCNGGYRIVDHQAESASLRVVEVACQHCGISRRLWFRIAATGPN
jgi:hypothetical protein